MTTDLKDSENLVLAAFNGNLENVKALLEAGADINAVGNNWNPLHAAIENFQVEVVEYLLKAGADVNFEYNGFRPIHHAIDIEIDAATQSNAPDLPEPIITKLLIDYGADINAINSNNETSLQMAIERNHKRAGELIKLTQGA